MIIVKNIDDFIKELREVDVNNNFNIYEDNGFLKIEVLREINKKDFKKIAVDRVRYNDSTFTYEVRDTNDIDIDFIDNRVLVVSKFKDSYDITSIKDIEETDIFIIMNKDIKEIIRKCNK